MNGSRLGKEFSANVFHDLFNNPNKQAEESKHNIFEYVPNQPEQVQTHSHSHSHSDTSLDSIFGILDINSSGSNDHEEENFVREQERKRKKIQKKRGRRM